MIRRNKSSEGVVRRRKGVPTTPHDFTFERIVCSNAYYLQGTALKCKLTGDHCCCRVFNMKLSKEEMGSQAVWCPGFNKV
uniref:Uncharacterized protein n=1 Tax=viral metagenome TaxID=1070528 RepID=A0A6M3L2Z2_9ZZZZ